jgi:hypothetical protein
MAAVCQCGTAAPSCLLHPWRGPFLRKSNQLRRWGLLVRLYVVVEDDGFTSLHVEVQPGWEWLMVRHSVANVTFRYLWTSVYGLSVWGHKTLERLFKIEKFFFTKPTKDRWTKHISFGWLEELSHHDLQLLRRLWHGRLTHLLFSRCTYGGTGELRSCALTRCRVFRRLRRQGYYSWKPDHISFWWKS